jgi:protein ImuA
MTTASSRQIAKLRRQLERREGFQPSLSGLISTGVSALDRLLPHGGLQAGTLVEYLGTGISLALAAARVACQDRALIILDRQRQFYPATWGTQTKTAFLRPANDADELWAIDQALRCPGVGAVMTRCGRLDQRDCRRLQLASECGGTLGLLIRPPQLHGRPTWADVQWLIEPWPSRDRWRLRVELLRCRGGTGGKSVILELDDTNTWHEADNANSLPSLPAMADSAGTRRRSRA